MSFILLVEQIAPQTPSANQVVAYPKSDGRLYSKDDTGTERTMSFNSGQIPFPATQNASADANTLDDYEEGTWTPATGGTATYTTQSGTYTKIGRLVFVRFALTIDVIGTGSTTDVSGLPFVPSVVSSFGVATFAGSATAVVSLFAETSGTNCAMRSMTAASSGAQVNAVFANGTAVILTGTYQV